MRKLFTVLAVLSMMLASVQPAIMQVSAAEAAITAESADSDALELFVGQWVADENTENAMFEDAVFTITADGTCSVKSVIGISLTGQIELHSDGEDENGEPKYAGTVSLTLGIQTFSAELVADSTGITYVGEQPVHFIRYQGEAENNSSPLSGEWVPVMSDSTENKDAYLIVENDNCIIRTADGAVMAGKADTAVTGTDTSGAPSYIGTLTFQQGETVINCDLTLDSSGLCFVGDQPQYFVRYAAADAFTAIIGDWAELGENGEQLGSMTVNKDGSFTAGEEKGSILIAAEQSPDGTYSYWFRFYQAGGAHLFDVAIGEEETVNEMYSGQDGARHFCRAELVSESGIAAAAGKWVSVQAEGNDYEDVDITISEDGSISLYTPWRTLTGTAALSKDADAATYSGEAVIGAGNNTSTVGLKLDGSSLWITGQISVEFIRYDAFAAIRNLAGKWNVFASDSTESSGTLTVAADGSVAFAGTDGSEWTGGVVVIAEENPDGTYSYWYNIYTSIGVEWNDFCIPGTEFDRIASDQDGATVLVRAEETVEPLFGDASGDGTISIEDAKKALDDHVMVNQVFSDPLITNETARNNADVTGDGKITEADAVAILKYVTMQNSMLEPSWYELTKNPNAPDAPVSSVPEIEAL